MLPWFTDRFPLYLAPMAGVTDTVFRKLCKEFGADVMVTEFVSAEGVFRKNARTLEYLEFSEGERPLGVQLFGADPAHLAEAARMIIEWKAPDFIDLNFGCPVNKVVSKNGGSALLRDCPLLEKVAAAVVKASAPVPVSAKIRIGWDANSINARTTAQILESAGVAAIAVHGRTKAQGYSGEADWEVIAQVAASVNIPVIGNGDISGARDVARHARCGIRGVMVGRAAMSAPWIFSEIKTFLATGEIIVAPPTLEEQWAHIRRHCALAVAHRGEETHTLHAMRSRLMAYSRGMPDAKMLRQQLQNVAALGDVDAIAERHLVRVRECERHLHEEVAAVL
ncbi:MAG TPA: tRNA dihydrouridine synthase DusB [Chthoniobacteraceae bacterium]|nr:tRNA dihydrouridine synthase DusB [Chthoniobacteraceae bacterium]